MKILFSQLNLCQVKWEQLKVEWDYLIGMHLTPFYLFKWNVKFHESNEHISSEYWVYWEKLCMFKSKMQLFEEEHAYSDLVATIWGSWIYFRWTVLILNRFWLFQVIFARTDILNKIATILNFSANRNLFIMQ